MVTFYNPGAMLLVCSVIGAPPSPHAPFLHCQIRRIWNWFRLFSLPQGANFILLTLSSEYSKIYRTYFTIDQTSWPRNHVFSHVLPVPNTFSATLPVCTGTGTYGISGSDTREEVCLTGTNVAATRRTTWLETWLSWSFLLLTSSPLAFLTPTTSPSQIQEKLYLNF